MKRAEDEITYPFRAVLFQYKNKPGEWHAVCVDNGAFGWGPTPEIAIHELALTVGGQIDETFETGTDFFFLQPDEEWVKAFEKGIPPGDDVRLVSSLTVHLSVRLHTKSKAAPELKIELAPFHRSLAPA